MTRTKLAKTAVKLDTENSTAPSNAISPRTSSAVFVEMQDTWLEIVLIGEFHLTTNNIEEC